MTTPRSQKTHLRVPISRNLGEFLATARQEWDKHHKPKKPGPDAETNRKLVFKILNNALKDQEVTPDTSLEKLTDCVEMRVGTYPHRDTIYKYAKMWRFKQRGFKVSKPDCSWIEKHSKEFFEELKNFKQRECEKEIGFIGDWFMSLRALRKRPDLNKHNEFDWEKQHLKRIKEDFLDLGPFVLGKGFYGKLDQKIKKIGTTYFRSLVAIYLSLVSILLPPKISSLFNREFPP